MVRDAELFTPAPSPRLEGLIAELTANANSPSARLAWVNRCGSRQLLRRVVFERPTLLLAVKGSKNVMADNQTHSSVNGGILLVPAGFELSVENIPDQASGMFLGSAIGFDATTIAQFRTLYAGCFPDWDLTPRWSAPYNEKLVSAITDWLFWSRRFAASTIEGRHRLMEILLLLAEQGAAGNLLLDQRTSLSARLRSLFALEPSRDWSLALAGRLLGVSISSLRRKLREQETSFRSLLEEARLGKGLELVLNSNLQIGQIAHACGYESQSRFSERFRLRFDMSPSEIRRTQAEPPAGHGAAPIILRNYRAGPGRPS